MPNENEFENQYDHFIQNVISAQHNIKLEGDLSELSLENIFPDYFKTFDCIYVEEGWVIDCYYYYNSESGYPVIYVRKTQKNIHVLLSHIDNGGYNNNLAIFDYCSTVKTFDHLKVTDLKIGLFQLLILQLIGDHFALFWHSLYSRIDIICSKRDLDKILKKIEFDSGISTTIQNINNLHYSEEITAVQNINCFPIIEENTESITYKLLIFRERSGLSEKTYTVKKIFPHTITLINEKLLVHYDCGICY